jgi:hypothetical protein
MNSKVIPLRREVLPANIFQMIEDYMYGTLVSIHVIGATADGRVVSTSAGDIPSEISRHDIKKRG